MCGTCDKKTHFSACSAHSAIESKKKHIVVQTLKLCTNVPPLHTWYAEKKTADHSSWFTPRLWKRWKDQCCKRTGLIIIPVFTQGTCSSRKMQLQSVIWSSRCSPSFVPQCALKETLIAPPTTTLQMWRARGKDKLLQHQDKDPLSSEGLSSHTFVLVYEAELELVC